MPITYATAVAAVGMLLDHGARQSLRNHYEQIRHVAHEWLMGESRLQRAVARARMGPGLLG